MTNPGRILVCSDGRAVPWVPLVHGVLEGLRAQFPNVDVRFVSLDSNPWVWEAELDPAGPTVAMFPLHHHEWHKGGAQAAMERCAALGIKVAILAYDDPYDHQTPLAAVQSGSVHHVETPESGCVKHYVAHGVTAAVLPPIVSTRLHYPPPENGAPERTLVSFVGGKQWRPRAAMLPLLELAAKRASLQYVEIAGVVRWLAGRQLTDLFHRSRITVEIPRFDLPTITNPYQVPCKWTGPRVYIAAATATPCLIVGPKPDQPFPTMPTCDAEHFVEALAYWLDAARGPELAARTDQARRDFVRYHQPTIAAAPLARRISVLCARADLGHVAVP